MTRGHEFKEHVSNQVKEYYDEFFVIERDWTPEQQEKFLNDHGWTQNKPTSKWGTDMWSHPDCSFVGCSKLVALGMAFRDECKKKRKQEIRDRTAVIKCNKCGDNLLRGEMGYYGMIDAEVNGGYDSDPLEDTLIYRFSLCEKCVYEMFLSFKEFPSIKSYL